MVLRTLTAVVILLFLTLISARYTWYSTSFEFKEMLKYDLKVLKEIRSKVQVQATEMKALRQAVQHAEKNISLRLSRVEEDYRNPISYMRLFDAVKGQKDILVAASKQCGSVLNKAVLSAMHLFPNKLDKIVTLQNLYSIQKSYGLDIQDLVQGIISEAKGHKMEFEECVEMASITLIAGDEELAIRWAKESLKMVPEDRPDLKRSLQNEIGNIEDKIKCNKLCGGGREETRSQRGTKCWLWDGNQDPWLILQPFKMEVVNTNPYIYRFYNVISDDEIEVLKNLSRGKLTAARTERDYLEPVTSESPRVAHHFIPSPDDQVVARLNDRVSRITGLDLSLSEDLMVATYGIGGRYAPHHDAGNTTLRRTATFMFYLSDIKKGGATVFVQPGLAILPQKGSALLWYNLLPSGYVNERTMHCACPVVLGSKWIANKWIHAETFPMCRKNEGLPGID